MTTESPHRPFSKRWMFISMAVFVAMELIISGLVGEFLLKRALSISLNFTIQGLLNLSGYFLGGLVVGFVSPGLRLNEPALGAFLSLGVMLSLSFFTPFAFIQFSVTKWIAGGLIAAFLAFTGSEIGERLSGHRLE